jgi:hypothetical protein
MLFLDIERFNGTVSFRLGLLSALLLPSCAWQSFDETTGTAHLWGIGHLSMSVNQAVDDRHLKAVTVGSDTVGIGVDTTPFASGLGLGYQGRRVAYVVSDNTALTIAKPSGHAIILNSGTPSVSEQADPSPKHTP